MKKIDKAVEIFLKREHWEYKAEIPHYVDSLKSSLIAVSCPSSYGLKDYPLCLEYGCPCEDCWDEELE